MNKNFPISGGGYIRILPWRLIENMTKNYLKNNSFYILYVHPFELSNVKFKNFPENTSSLTKFRFLYGRKNMKSRLNRIIKILKDHGYTFKTLMELRKNFLNLH